MQHISTCFLPVLDLIEKKFVESPHPNASKIVDYCLLIRDKYRDGDVAGQLWFEMADLMNGGADVK